MLSIDNITGEIAKVTIFSYILRIFGLYFIYVFLRNKKDWLLDKKILVVAAMFVTIAVISSLLGSDSIKSLIGNYYRKDGLLTLFQLVGFSFLISYFWKEKYRKLISTAFFGSSLLFSLLSIFGLNTTFGNSIYLAGFLSVSLPFGYYLYKVTDNKLYLLGLLLIIYSIFLLGVIGGILTVFLFTILLILIENKSKMKYFAISIPIVLGLIFFSNWVREYQLLNNSSFIFEGRQRIFRNLIVAFTNKPFTGYGWSNVDYAFESVVWPAVINDDVYLDKAHSEFLEVLVTTGIIGFALYFALLIQLLGKNYRQYKKTKDAWYMTICSVLILFIFHSQTNIISITEQLILWLIVGLTLNLSNLQEV